VARQVWARAIGNSGYYERLVLVPGPDRISGQRPLRHHGAGIVLLSSSTRARLGFTLDEVRELFLGFRAVPRASERWQALSVKKLAELDTLMKEIRTMRRLLRKMMDRCHCDTLDQCGRASSGAESFP